jgi:hypothetical protein
MNPRLDEIENGLSRVVETIRLVLPNGIVAGQTGRIGDVTYWVDICECDRASFTYGLQFRRFCEDPQGPSFWIAVKFRLDLNMSGHIVLPEDLESALNRNGETLGEVVLTPEERFAVTEWERFTAWLESVRPAS